MMLAEEPNLEVAMPVSIRSLLEAGVHFGHQTRRWNPKMKPYIFTERSGIYILDLQRTQKELDHARKFVLDLVAGGGSILFVGTKKQAQEPIANEAERSGQPYINHRWMGGMLTNFVTMRQRVARLVELETMETDGRMASLPKKEQLLLRKEWAKLDQNLNGVREMTKLPAALFVVDTKREAIAVAEARRLRIPIIGLVDTNGDPDEVDIVIPGNDDAIRAIALMCKVIADAAITGTAVLEGPIVAAPAVEAATVAAPSEEVPAQEEPVPVPEAPAT
ncbi:MAG: 30S ribosomal protein S2 [Actinobacteria bacterium]|nr:30S ribosomal protein S2 [Actinomycetota bacterium]